MGVMRIFYFLLAIIPSASSALHYPQLNYPFHNRNRVPAPPISLNTLTLVPHNQDQNDVGVMMDDLAELIHTNFQSIEDGTHVLIKNKANGAIKKKYAVHKGIKLAEKENFVTVFSRGFARESSPASKASQDKFSYQTIIKYLIPSFNMRGLQRKGGGFVSASAALRNNLIHTSCVTFDYPDTRSFIDFAQHNDLKCLNTVMQQISDKYKIISMGVSRGATASLKYELSGAKKSAVLILESPFASIQNVMNQLTKNCFYCFPGMHTLVQLSFKLLFPRYKTDYDNLFDLLPQINPHIPILITHLENDLYISDKAMFTMINTLSKYNQHIYLLVLTDETNKAIHGRLSSIEPYQWVVNAFLEKNGMPHDEKLAIKGKELLERAQANAYVNHHKDWILTECYS